MQLLATAGCASRLLQSRKRPDGPSVACCEPTQLRDFCECRHGKSHSPPAPHPGSAASFPLASPCELAGSLGLRRACLHHRAISGCD